MLKSRFSRRYFFYGLLLAGATPSRGFGSVPSLKSLGYKSPNEKLDIAGIGAGSQAFNDLLDAEQDFENIVALADVDWDRGKRGLETWPKAAKYKDFRKMFEKSGKDIDAVVIGIPDHMHAICAMACMQLGKHVYVEKPVTRTAWEERLLTQAAAKYKVATQMGNHGYSHEATRVACKGGMPACSNFSIAGPYTEWMVLGSAAIHAQGRLLWDNAKGEFPNNREVNKWVKPTFRKGWEISL
jgi:hypothetical protein